MTATRCTHCGATLTWLAGQQFQVCWSCAKVTKRAGQVTIGSTKRDVKNVGSNPTRSTDGMHARRSQSQ